LRTGRSPALIILFILPLFVFMSVEEEHNAADPMAFVGKVINFVVLFGGLAFLLYKPTKKFLSSRGEEIADIIQETDKNRVNAESALQEAHSRLQELAQEVKHVRQDAEESGQGEKDRILQEATREAERIREMTSQEIELLLQIGTRELKEFAGGLATDRAREKIQKKMTSEDQIRLIDQSIEKLGNYYEKSSSD